MFGRFPIGSMRALFSAKAIALSTGTPFIDAPHLLAGAIEAWPAAGSRRAEVLARVGLAVPTESPDLSPEIPFSPSVKRLLNQATAEADRLGHHRIRPEHLLLAFLEDPSGSPAVIFRQCGIDRDVLVQSAAQAATLDDTPLGYKGRLEVRNISAPPEEP